MKPEDRSDLVYLREVLDRRFSARELKRLCFDLGLDYDDLPGSGQADKAQELVALCERLGEGALARLVAQVRALRPAVSWAGTRWTGAAPEPSPASEPDHPDGYEVGPLAGQPFFEDDRIHHTVLYLAREHQQQGRFLPLTELVPELNALFKRNTFRNEPQLASCTVRDWGARLHHALQTLAVLRAYERNVRQRGTSAQEASYDRLLAAVDRYVMAMATHLFERPVPLGDLHDLVAGAAFREQLPPAKTFAMREGTLHFPQGEDRYCDAPLAEAIAAMDELLASLGPSDSGQQATLHGSGAIAQGPGATAVGAGGLYVGGNVEQSSIVQGSGNVVSQGGDAQAGGIRVGKITGAKKVTVGADVQGGDLTDAAALAAALLSGDIAVQEIAASEDVAVGLRFVRDAARPTRDELRQEVEALRAQVAEAIAAGAFADPDAAEDVMTKVERVGAELAQAEPSDERIVKNLHRSAELLAEASQASKALGALAPRAAALVQLARTLFGP